MVQILSRALLVACLSIGLSAFVTPHAEAQAVAKGSSGLPLPRFVSLKAKRVNLRIGPSTDYAVSWLYLKSGLPVEIIQEYENWRRIRDADGTEGWVSQTLLSGERTAVAAPWMRGNGDSVFVSMRQDSLPNASVVAKLEPGVVVRLNECNGNWCRVEAGGVKGWVNQGEIWGAYPGEAFK
ncbi:SH3 domain-containing protein [Rhizobium daejeonense]|uniref:SH3 domain-containing protein n=1 Tax=Rhizobium daejeonense TaxID=240521 RepID=A0A6M1S6W7_9HYPH|nr:SH3 domain-containing protein [Rhizobium daejeonense]NGO65047.1 SH3 domain-containing protein [Rhizobium daejeonense]